MAQPYPYEAVFDALIPRLPPEDRVWFSAEREKIREALAAAPDHAGWRDEQEFLLGDLLDALSLDTIPADVLAAQSEAV